MANWTDGPEYAPLDRPAAFQTPAAEPLEVPVAAPNPAAGAPTVQPAWRAPEAASVPLEALVPAATLPPRDPRTEFSTISSVVTSGSAWGSAHSTSGTPDRAGWTPDQPLGTSAAAVQAQSAAPAFPPPSGAPRQAGFPPPAPSGPPPPALNFPPPQQSAPSFPQPGTPDWFAPPPQAHWHPPNQTVSVAQMWNAATPGVIIPLLVGALVSPLSLVMLVLSSVLAARVRYRRDQVRRSYVWAGTILAFTGVLSLLSSDFDFETAWGVLSGWAQLACWVLPIVVLLQVGAGIRANEPPQRPY